ncbi:MAG: hypothetical protein GWN86_04775 [Desulfobacterales bacterium]|nr:hypothetical protein [Desulfobacterales bacterium]
MSDITDYPFDQFYDRFQAAVKAGHKAYARWTCTACGERITHNKENVLPESKDYGHRCGCRDAAPPTEMGLLVIKTTDLASE